MSQLSVAHDVIRRYSDDIFYARAKFLPDKDMRGLLGCAGAYAPGKKNAPFLSRSPARCAAPPTLRRPWLPFF
jgi:hypothetical protein